MANQTIPRNQRVAREIKAILGSYFIKKFPTSDFGLLSVAAVALSKDLKLAKVYVSCFQTEVSADEILQEFEILRNDMQNELSRQLKTKYIPRLRFFIDNCFEENFELLEKLKSLGFSTTAGDMV